MVVQLSEELIMFFPYYSFTCSYYASTIQIGCKKYVVLMELYFIFLRSWRTIYFVLLEVYLFFLTFWHTRWSERHICFNRFPMKTGVKGTLNELIPNWLNGPVLFISTILENGLLVILRYVFSLAILFNEIMNGWRNIFFCKLFIINKSLKTRVLIERPDSLFTLLPLYCVTYQMAEVAN